MLGVVLAWLYGTAAHVRTQQNHIDRDCGAVVRYGAYDVQVTSQDTNLAAVILANGSVVGLWRSKQCYPSVHMKTQS